MCEPQTDLSHMFNLKCCAVLEFLNEVGITMLSMCSSVNFQLNFQQCAVKCYVLVYTDG